MKILNLFFCITFLGIASVSMAQYKSKIVASKAPSVTMAMDIQKSILVPLLTLEKKNANSLVKELANITEDLYNFALKKVAGKYEAFLSKRKSFEPGLLNSEFKFAYLESWIEMTSKRVRKVTDYKGRLEKIQERVNVYDKKLDALKEADDALYEQLKIYSDKVKEKLTMTSEWLASSNILFTNELNKLKSREKAFKKAGVPKV